MKWRASVLESQIDILNTIDRELKQNPSGGSSKQNIEFEQLQDHTTKELDCLECELKNIDQGQFIREDIQDSTAQAESAYIDELYKSFRLASMDGAKDFKKMKIGAMPRKNFIHKYYGARKEIEPLVVRNWCCVLGAWFDVKVVTCVHIVPISFESKELDYLFGTRDAALHTARNRLYMYHTIETAFDNGFIAIVPDGSVDVTPTEWKIVLLNEDVRNNIVAGSKKEDIVRWGVS